MVSPPIRCPVWLSRNRWNRVLTVGIGGQLPLNLGPGKTEGAALEALARSTEADARDPSGTGNIQVDLNVLGGQGGLQIG